MTAVIVPSPYGTSWSKWSGEVASQFSGNYTPPPDEKEWRSMAISVMNSSPFNRQSILHPDSFKTWQEWAAALARVTVSGV